MHIILLHPNGGQSRHLRLPRHPVWWLVGILVILPALVGVGAYYVTRHLDDPLFTDQLAHDWQQRIDSQQKEVGKLNQRADEEMHALTLKLADMQAQLVRLDALGERLVDVAGVKSDEFDFQEPPAIGGPEAPASETAAYKPPAFVDTLDSLSKTLDRREQQLNVLEGLLEHKRQARQTMLSGRPVKHGWMSSRFGYRTDPFTGRLSFHPGMDFAAKKGTRIYATASGVVTYAGPRGGYGNMIQINHGHGISTRYGHAEKLLVKRGDIVHRGEAIALMGSTGRSTGPHVHYEVRKNGHPVNPRPYVYRQQH